MTREQFLACSPRELHAKMERLNKVQERWDWRLASWMALYSNWHRSQHDAPWKAEDFMPGYRKAAQNIEAFLENAFGIGPTKGEGVQVFDPKDPKVIRVPKR